MAEIIEMPKLSDTMTTGTLVKWLKNEGDEVSAGDMIAEVETDKATMEVENFEDGFILKIYAQEGESVDIGAPICAVGEKGEDAPEVESGGSTSASESDDEKESQEEDSSDDSKEEESSKEEKKESGDKEEKKSESKSKPQPSTEPTRDRDGRIKASPLARKVAEEKGVDLEHVEGTGPNGRIVKSDVLTAAEKPQPAKATQGSVAVDSSAMLEEKSIKVTNMRSAIAKALVKSKQDSPHFYLQSEVDTEPLIKFRKSLNDKLADLSPEQGGIKFSVNDLILKASAVAVRRVPAINRSWEGDTIKQHGSVHLAFGVAIDDGLITPVIRDAQAKSLRQVSSEAKELIVKARDRKLKPDEMSGSTLTVTNLGMYGITDFYGIINPPNAAILSVGATVKQPIVGDNNEIKIGYRMKVGLSGDHRTIDGAVGAMYLAALKEILESPALMLV